MKVQRNIQDTKAHLTARHKVRRDLKVLRAIKTLTKLMEEQLVKLEGHGNL